MCNGATAGRAYAGFAAVAAVAGLIALLWGMTREGALLHGVYVRQQEVIFACKNYLITVYVTAQIMVSLSLGAFCVYFVCNLCVTPLLVAPTTSKH